MFEIVVDLPESDLVPGYNHVHHARAFHYLELARLAYLEEIGFPNNQLIAQGLFLVITDVQVRYLRELTEGPLRVTCENQRVEERALIIEQRILNPKGKTAVSGVITSMCMSGATKRAIPPPEDLAAAFSQPRGA